MKKKLISTLLILVLVLSIAPVTAYAADINITVNTGEYFDRELQSVPFWDDVDRIAASSTAGCSLYTSGSSVCLSGTIYNAGEYNFKYLLIMKDGSELAYTVCVTVRTPDKYLPNASYDYKAGENVYIELDSLSTGGEIFDVSYTGKLPNELSFAAYDSFAVISGTAETHGVFNVTVKAFDDISQGWRFINLAIGITAVPVPTKQPTDENIDEKGTAEFVAWANYLQEVRWKLVSPNGGNVIYSTQAAGKFSGLGVSVTQATGKLTLTNVPYELNGWKIVAEFWGAGGSCESTPALLTVNRVPLKEPVITGQPQSIETESGNTAVLKVTAESPDKNTLTYQWYKNTKDSNNGGTAIQGAEEDRYSPQLAEGESAYFYCVVKNNRGSESRQAVSDAAQVKVIKPEASPEPTEEPKETEKPSEEANVKETPKPEATKAPSEPAVTVITDNEKTGKSFNILPFIIGLIAIAVIVVLVLLVLAKRREAAANAYQGKHGGAHIKEDSKKNKHLK